MYETFWKDWKGGAKEHNFENLIQLKVGSAMKLETPEWKVNSQLTLLIYMAKWYVFDLSFFIPDSKRKTRNKF